MSEGPIQEPLDDERGNPTAANQQAGAGPVGRENEDRDAARDPTTGNPGPSAGEPDGASPDTGNPGPEAEGTTAAKDPGDWATGEEP